MSELFWTARTFKLVICSFMFLVEMYREVYQISKSLTTLCAKMQFWIGQLFFFHNSKIFRVINLCMYFKEQYFYGILLAYWDLCKCNKIVLRIVDMYLTRGWVIIIWTGLNIKIGIAQKVYEFWNCSFVKMIVPSGENS